MMKIAYDVKLKRPACAILQAVYGGTRGIEGVFDSEYWLTHQTPDMRLYYVTAEQLEKLVILTRQSSQP